MSNQHSSCVPPHRWHGPIGAPVVVLISGLGGKGTSWRPFLAAISKSFRVLTLDNRGAGRALPIAGAVTIRDFALDVLRLFDALALERAVVIGRSMGGMIAQELALAAPDRITRLVLASTTGRCDAHTRALFEHMASLAEAGFDAGIRHRASMLWCLGAEALADDALIAPYMKARGVGDRPADYARQARACAAHDALNRLGRVRIPTLVVGGTDDRYTPPRHSEQLAEALPTASLELISGAGHLAYLEKPRAFEAAVMGFLGGHQE